MQYCREGIQYWSHLASLQVPGGAVSAFYFLFFAFLLHFSCGHICWGFSFFGEGGYFVLFCMAHKLKGLFIFFSIFLGPVVFKVNCKSHINFILSFANYSFLTLLLQHISFSTNHNHVTIGYWSSSYIYTCVFMHFSSGRKWCVIESVLEIPLTQLQSLECVVRGFHVTCA